MLGSAAVAGWYLYASYVSIARMRQAQEAPHVLPFWFADLWQRAKLAQLMPDAENMARDLVSLFDTLVVAMHAVVPCAHEDDLSLCRRYFGCGASGL